MNFADIADCKPSDIVGLRLVYIRNKTKKKYNIPITPQAGAILDRHKGGEYLFPIYDASHQTDNERFKRSNLFRKAVNEWLRILAQRAGIESAGFSFYVARHTYANAHKQMGTSRELIKELMGHSDYKTAEHYLSQFPDDALDQADRALFDGG